MRIGLRKKEKRVDLAIKHICLLIDGKKYHISFHYSLYHGIKEISINGKPAEVIDAYPTLPKLIKICVGIILLDLKFIVKRIVRRIKVHNRLDEHR